MSQQNQQQLVQIEANVSMLPKAHKEMAIAILTNANRAPSMSMTRHNKEIKTIRVCITQKYYNKLKDWADTCKYSNFIKYHKIINN